MLLNEKVEDFFSNKELESLRRMQSSQDNYNNLQSDIENPYNPNLSQILDFSIKDDDSKNYEAKMSGIIDYTNSQFVIKKLTVNEYGDKRDIVTRLLNSVIVNMETTHPDISCIYWRVNKENNDCIYAALGKGFTVQDSNSFSMELVYYLMSTPFRQSNNTIQVNNILKKHE